MLIDSRFALFGPKRGPTSAWLGSTVSSHIFHDCVQRSRSHVFSIISCCSHGLYFFPLACCWRPFNGHWSQCKLGLWSVGNSADDRSLLYLALCVVSLHHYHAVCPRLFVRLACTPNPRWVVIRRVDVNSGGQEFPILCPLDLSLCLSGLPGSPPWGRSITWSWLYTRYRGPELQGQRLAVYKRCFHCLAAHR